jgi:hypothetical protein
MTQQELVEGMRFQSATSSRSGSPLYAELFELAARDVEAGGAMWQFLEPAATAESPRSLLPLRFLALFHRMALDGSLPELAACYPSCSGELATRDAQAAYRTIVSAIARGGLPALPARVQTNECGRCRALLPGFAAIAAVTGSTPWRLLEPGSSAGLNLLWDQYDFVRAIAAFPIPEIVERRGCDLAPVTQEEMDSLPAFVWPDQLERFAMLRQAIATARRGMPAPVDAADAVAWCEEQLLQKPWPDRIATVLFHSIFWLYLDQPSKQRLEAIFIEAGTRRATSAAPFAWLRMEPDATASHAEISLTMWPGPGDTRLIATSGLHGADVRLAD